MMYAMAITVPAFDISVNPWNMRIMDNKTDLLDILRSIAASVESIAQSLDDIADASAALARTTAAYHCLRSALAIHAGDPPSRQALDRAEKIRRGVW